MLKRTFSVVAALFLFSLFIGTPKLVQAEAGTAGKSITVVPPSFELFANPGDSVSEKITVQNQSNTSNTYAVSVEDFKAVGEEGGINLSGDQDNTTYSLAKWVVPEPKNFSIAAGGSKDISFTINVPKNAEPGGHYASVLVQMGGGSVSSGAAVTSRVGSLILLRISGNVKEDASVESFTTANSYYQSAPVNIDLRVKDNGNNHIKPQGTIVITNIFGQKVSEIQLNGLNVLPDAIRKMETEWKPSGFLASRYTATLVATYGEQNKSLSATTSFYVIPKWLLIAIAVVIVILLLMIRGRKRLRRALHNITR